MNFSNTNPILLLLLFFWRTVDYNILIMIICIDIILQVMAILARPNKMSKFRKYWNWYHQNVGRILIIFTIANIFYGIHLGENGHGWSVGYGVVLGILFIISVVLEIRIWIRK